MRYSVRILDNGRFVAMLSHRSEHAWCRRHAQRLAQQYRRKEPHLTFAVEPAV